jgi:RNA polymerase sigma-70 factor (ECF subfamily)
LLVLAIVKRCTLHAETGVFVSTPIPFEEVYSRWSLRVYRFCVSQVGDPAVAEDIAAETFKSAFAAYERTKPDPDGLQAWLFRIARNAVTDHRRSQFRWLGLLGRLGSNLNHSSDIESNAQLRDEVRDAFAALANLKKRERLLVSLRVGGELSYAEIAKVVGMSEQATGMATRRALDKLRQNAQELSS